MIHINFESKAAIPPKVMTPPKAAISTKTDIKERFQLKAKEGNKSKDASLIFDIPVTYNKKVSYWIQYYQTKGRVWFREWLERATKYMPYIQKELSREGLPSDLAYMVMIESGFSTRATSTAQAVGPWQFIAPTGERYGLKINNWLDERRDVKKSTLAAIKYIRDLHKEFGSWYLVAASYNMGENGLRKQIQKYNTKDFWKLSRLGALPVETVEYVPKILAAMMISKVPALYGFRDVAKMKPYEYEVVYLPGGTNMNELADYLGVTQKALRDLNSELILDYIPSTVKKHMVRIPRGSLGTVISFLENQKQASAKPDSINQ